MPRSMEIQSIHVEHLAWETLPTQYLVQVRYVDGKSENVVLLKDALLERYGNYLTSQEKSNLSLPDTNNVPCDSTIKPFEKLEENISNYLKANFPATSTTSTDIFEHAVLHTLGYNFVPEHCAFNGVFDNDKFNLLLRLPHKQSLHNFKRDLRTVLDGTPITLINEPPNKDNFVVRLQIPYHFINNKINAIYKSINKILESEKKREFYEFWNKSSTKKHESFAFTADNMQAQVKNHLHALFPRIDAWNTVLKFLVGKKTNIPFSKIKIINDVVCSHIDEYPQVTVNFKVKQSKKQTIALYRHEILRLALRPEESLLDTLEQQQEHIVPRDIQAFLQKTFRSQIVRDNNGKYHLTLIYPQSEKLRILEKFGVCFTDGIYSPVDEINYMKATLALKELSGIPCFKERLHRLKYCCKQLMWDELKKELAFCINFSAQTGLPIPYYQLAFELFEYATQLRSDDLIALLVDLFTDVVNHKSAYKKEMIIGAYKALEEIRQMRPKRKRRRQPTIRLPQPQ